MAQSQPHTLFGIHSMTAYNINTGIPFGQANVLGAGGITSEGELLPLTGGSNRYPWIVERGLITAEITMTIKEVPDFLFETLLGKKIIDTGAKPGGEIDATKYNNRNGSSVKDATTGVASIVISNAGNLKFSTYVIEAVSATTLNVYGLTDLDFGKGAAKQYIDDSLKLNAAPLTLSNGGALNIAGFGFDLVGGTSVAMIVGDTAVFEVVSESLGSREVVIGSTTERFIDFGLLLAATRSGSGEMTYFDCYRVAGAGFPFNLTAVENNESEITMQMFRDVARDGIYSYRNILGIN